MRVCAPFSGRLVVASMPPLTMLSSDVEEVGEVRFSMMTAEDIRAMSACEVTSTELFNGVSPVPGGLYDPRMGAYDYGSRCHTCMHSNAQCPGHFGHVELASPVFNIETLAYVKKYLKCICTRCASLMLRPDDPDLVRLSRRKISNKKRWDIVVAACAKSGVKNCPACGARRADSVAWDKKTAAAMILTWKAEGDAPAETLSLDGGQVDALFRRVSAHDACATGVERPDALLLSALPVPPIAVRPPAKNSAGQRRDDDLTIKLVEIVKKNNLLKARVAAGANADTLSALTVGLQNDVITYINNSATAGAAIAKVKATNRALRSVTSRLKGKDGRIRGNLSGKRVDQSARSVITPDPNISVEELGMPLRVAKTLSMPEVVRADNKERLQAAVENGPGEYPGAVYVKVAASGALIQLKRVEARRRIKLEEGDIVHRHLLNGDVVLFNRQPSLHRMSMMAHRVRVMPYDTFRLSVMVTPPYNADFDGDEMNAHCPQSATTATELRMLSGVASQIITPREHAPIIGVVQDVALGLHLITDADVRVNRKAACNLTAHLSTCSGDIGPQTWTGRQLLSSLLPQTLHVDKGGELIEFGVVKPESAQLRKDSYQRATDGVLHSVYNDNGPQRAVRLLDDTQNLACDWLVTNGFSVGIGDLLGKQGLRDAIAAASADVRTAVGDMLNSLHTGEFVSDPFMSDSELVESLAKGHLEKKFFDVVGAAAMQDSKDLGSRLLAMINAGSKGKKMNVYQMVGALGQQSIEQGRVPLSFEGRVMPHFCRYDDGCEARGNVESSFVEGLNPKEFFMHALAGREGLIDTAVKSVTGDTPIVVVEDGAARHVLIGDWIDARLAGNPSDVAHFEERRMELLDIEGDVRIPTTDEHGRVTWGRVTAVTRHDPGDALYRVRTAGGRSVVVTESKSLLTWNEELGRLKEVATPDIRVGDHLPVTLRLQAPHDAPDEVAVGARKLQLRRQAGLDAGRALAGGACEDAVAAEFVLDGHVPAAAFVAPADFCAGMLEGYLSVAGSATAKGTTARCASRRLADGLCMLCSRLGVLGETTDADEFVVRGRWKDLLEAKLRGLDPFFCSSMRHNDVVLDRIVEIAVLGVQEHPKVYDLTVPATLNFGLANGLQVRDTSETGYLQRKLIKALEDCKVSYDRSVRMANGAIVQFMYGDDGMDACSVETHDFAVMRMDLAQLADEHLWTPGDVEPMGALLSAKLAESLQTDDSVFERLEAHFRAIVSDKDSLTHLSSEVYHPIAFDRLLVSAAKSKSRGYASDLHPAIALDAIDELVSKMGVGPNSRATPLLAALLRASLSPKVLVRRYGMNAAGLEAAKSAIERAFMSALCSPSEMVGILAAQSLAEPLTQMVLNTFHTAGVGSATKQLNGVPRIKELLNFTKNPKTPVMKVMLRRPDKQTALLVRDRVCSTTVADIMESSSLMYDADDFASEPRIAALYQAFGVDVVDPQASPWLLKIQFDRAKMLDAAVHMHDVHRALTEAFVVGSLHSDDGSDKLVIRLRPPATSADMMSELTAFEEAVMATRVSGVPDIRVAHEFVDDSKKYDAAARAYVAREGEWCLRTQGTNLKEILGMDGVDVSRTTTNVIHEILETLGIEAARAALLLELSDNYSSHNASYVNHRHIALLVDFMVLGGGITAIDRHGINHGDIGPLAKCSFEQPVDNLVRAAVFGECDHVEGVSASIMLGQVARCGTGDGDIILDAEAYASIDGDRADPADLRLEADKANEPALDSLLAFSFTNAAARAIGLRLNPRIVVAE